MTTKTPTEPKRKKTFEKTMRRKTGNLKEYHKKYDASCLKVKLTHEESAELALRMLKGDWGNRSAYVREKLFGRSSLLQKVGAKSELQEQIVVMAKDWNEFIDEFREVVRKWNAAIETGERDPEGESKVLSLRESKTNTAFFRLSNSVGELVAEMKTAVGWMRKNAERMKSQGLLEADFDMDGEFNRKRD